MQISAFDWRKTAGPSESSRRYAIIAFWFLASGILAWALVQGYHSLGTQGTILAILVLALCGISMKWWLPNPIAADPLERATRKGWLVLLSALALGLLIAVTALFGPPIMFAFPLVGLICLLLVKQPIAKREWVYALGLALVAGIAGLGAQWIVFITPLQWGILQVPIVLGGLLAGWGILRATELASVGVGRSRFLTEGLASAFKGFFQGVLIGMPWALGAVVMGTSGGAKASWVQFWWQPFIAIQPGIAEEAWGRMLFVPLLFLLLRRVASKRAAFATAIAVIAVWFAFLHTSGDPVSALVSTLISTALFILPVSFLCFYRDLETAIGFHFWMDFCKFAFSLILHQD